MVKWKQSGKVNFSENNLRIQFDVVFDFESNGGISDSLEILFLFLMMKYLSKVSK